MLETSARLLRLLSLLQARRDWTGADLADRLGVSARTVRRDVERLRDLGYPVHATRGTDGGYRLGAGAAMPGIEETSVRALAKLEQVLPSRLRRRVNALQTYTVRIPPDSPVPTVEPAVLTVLAACCRDHERLRFDYRDHDGSASVRTVEPHRLVNWGRRWYLVAWDVDRRDWRTFRVDRIAPREPTGPRFPPRDLPDNDIAAYVSRRVSAAAWQWRARITVHAPADVVTERINPAVGVVEAVDEHTCVLVTGADSIDVIAVYASLLGVDFEVTEPPELVEYVATLAGRYARAAGAA